MSTTPNYTATPKSPCGQVSVANTARDGTGTLVTVHTAGSSGCRVEEVIVTATNTTTAGMVRLFVDYSGTIRLLAEVLIDAITPSGTVRAFSTRLVFDDFVLQAGAVLKASTHNAETFNVFMVGGDF